MMDTIEDDNLDSKWPPKFSLFGVNVSAVNYGELLSQIIDAAKSKRSAIITHLAVHGLVEGSRDSVLRNIINKFQIVAPDGHPVRIALNLLYDTKLPDRCYGPEFMRRVCQHTANEGIGIYLYGSYQYVVDALMKNLLCQYPNLDIRGWEPSIFKPLSMQEDEALVRRINESGAAIVFVGLGCPLQERFAYEHANKIKGVQICVGAAFDFLSKNKKMAPNWMQRHSLEWLFRFFQEPSRLWRRYLYTNTMFLYKLFLQYSNLKQH